MKKILVHSKTTTLRQDYIIYVGVGLIEQIRSLIPLHMYTKSMIVTGHKTPITLVKRLQVALPHKHNVITIESGEQKNVLKASE